ncbi:aldolase/citrate lyase family protein [Streptomyces camelliae]|uniref:Aldolase/citrate lyase family protein n=1 Tax=Streptomyces camelliae TaxID=3004093 RepID=A0ABY7P0E6_9ACTN|nr:aldolase/citrate lyase family protein [Streptomyces sp. HUAS 2-6]WBO61743.1 aldolase/citrate lyase family protein [Streptomyces sp. HUAS 2-6]
MRRGVALRCRRHRHRHTLLFVPGSRRDRFDKAASAGADRVVIDLQDTVAPEDEGDARHSATAWLAQGNRCRRSAPWRR